MSDQPSLKSDLADSFHAAIQMGASVIKNLKDLHFVSYETVPADDAVKQMCDGPIHKIQMAVRTARKLLAFLPRNVPPQAVVATTEGSAPATTPQDTPFDTAATPPFDLQPADHGINAVEGTPDPKKDRFREELHHFLTELAKAYHAVQAPTPLTPPPEGSTPNARAANAQISIAHLTDLCTRIVAELQDVEQRLAAAIHKQSKWDLIAEGEEARYRTITGLYAGLSLAMRLLDPAGKPATVMLPAWQSELETAQLARDVLLSLSQVLMPLSVDADHAPFQQIPPCLRTIRWQLDHVVEQPSYAMLRAHDRHQLQTLRTQLAAWLDTHVRDETEARALLATVHAFALRIAAINNRALLVAHDRALQHKAIDQLHGLTHPRRRLFQRAPELHAPLTQLLDELRPLRWRDQQLHTFLEEADALEHRSRKDIKTTLARLDSVLRAIRM